MERSFKKEIEALKLGEGDIFEGEGILAVTKALLQSGVAYVGGYQGSPVSNLLDVMVQAKDYMKELGVHVEACANESSAAAMLGASINYPVRGAVTWKSIVGTNVASDALSHLASVGVLGGSLIIIGEDYGEGSSIIQERTHGVALKSTIWLMDPRPNLEVIVRTVHKAFELSEYSHTPVMMQLRIRTCHLQGKFIAKNNIKPQISSTNKIGEVAPHNYDLIAHPPSTYAQEKLKYGQRAKFGLVLNKMVREKKLTAPIVIGRDHLDCGSVASPNRETEAMKDGSDAVADWPLLNAMLNIASGASWVSFHHGGGVGMGYSLHAGQVIVADGTIEMDNRLKAVLTNDPGMGIYRHADAGYEDAIDNSKKWDIDIPMLDHKD